MGAESCLEDVVVKCTLSGAHLAVNLPSMIVEGGARTHQPGERVCGYFEIQRSIGRGGMGEVYAARNTRTGRLVALKIIRGSDGELPEERRRRFKREARAATAINHPHVVEVFDVLEDADGYPVMVMELLEGESLAEMIMRERKLPLGAACAALAPVAGALAAAHAKGIVHRDLKPDNVFLARNHEQVVPKVLDFGIAKVLDPGSISSDTQGGLPTATNALLGTPHYMSYEQAMSEKDIDARSDVWSLGVILFELLAGRRPLVFENLGEMYTQLLSGEVPSITLHAPTVPAELAALVDHALKKDKAARLADLAPLIAELERHADAAELALCTRRSTRATGAVRTADAFSTSRPASSRVPGVSRWWLGIGAVGVAAAASVAVWSGQAGPELASFRPEPAAQGGTVAGKAQDQVGPATEPIVAPSPSPGGAPVEPSTRPPTPPKPLAPQPGPQPVKPDPSVAPPPPPPTGIIEKSPYKKGGPG
jgi:serine/threonine protein kinase